MTQTARAFGSIDFGALNSFRASCFALRILTAAIFSAGTALAEFPHVPPTPPDQAEATFEVLHGFRMELIAAEPLVIDPVDMAYDEDGRAYVVEMRDYPFPEEMNAPPTEFPGTVRLLEDTDGDGKFDKSTVFADGLAWPTSVCCWKGGVFVAAAPDIWYFKDTDGDGLADVRRKVFTGFSRYNVQAIMNSLRLGLDNKIYGAAAGNGGSVRHAERPDVPLVQLTRRDFRFDPVTEQIEAISGGQRFGATFDDWGNRFLCNIRNPVQHVVLPLEYVQRNPHLVVPSVIHDVAEAGDQLRVYRISPPEAWREFRAQRWGLEGVNYPRSELIGAGYWTSSSGVTVYRGAAWPEQFRGNVFIGEVAGNLVHRQVLARDGVTFKSRRADENTEFVRSRDIWFRPVNFANAPDGTLHVLDMCREAIEHPWSIPDDIKAQLDLASGNDRGRIYRLAPTGFTPPKPPRLSQATTAELVAHLESPHGWWRDTAQRLLVERQDKNAVPLLRTILRRDSSPVARLHALYTLSGLQSLSYEDASGVMFDGPAELARHAVLLAERHHLDHPQFTRDLADLADEPDIAVRFQVALTASRYVGDRAARSAVAKIAPQDAADPWMRLALLSSPEPQMPDLRPPPLEPVATRRGRCLLIRQIAAMTAVRPELGLKTINTLKQLADERLAVPDDIAYAVLAGTGEGLSRRSKKLGEFIDGEPWSTAVRGRLDSVTAAAGDSNRPVTERLAALELLPWLRWVDVRATLIASLQPSEPREVQHAALRVLGTFNESTVAGELVARWRQFTPPLRDEAVGILLSRAIWHEALVEALERGDIPPAQVSIPHRARLAALRDTALAERAKQVLASVALGPRKEVVERYQEALSLAGNRENGAKVYQRECANCHKLGGAGHDVGPNLETIQHRSPQEVLIHVLDPNREVSPDFLDYTVRLTDGRVLTGMIVAETDSGLTLRRAEKHQDSILRSQIDEIASSGKSLMPEGLEQKVTQQEMADLLAFLKQPQSIP
jgi:putative membrane-bound dehydrogenase-like protein